MVCRFDILENEHWWGGSTGRAMCPFDDSSEYSFVPDKGPSNQTMPFFVSDKGRYIWSEKPFTLEAKDGKIVCEGENVGLFQAGNTLRQSYMQAQKKHFPSNGRMLPNEFFETAQYNTWMEFTYYPTQDKVIEFAKGYVENGFLPGIFIIDEGWHGRYGDWEFDRARFPDPAGMIAELHQMGFKVLLWVVPFVCADGPKFVRTLRPLVGTDPEAAKSIYLRNTENEVAIIKWWNGFGAVLDMNNHVDAGFLGAQLKHLMDDYGVDGFKFDGGSVGSYAPQNVINGKPGCVSNQYELNIAWNEFGSGYEYHEYKDTYGRGGKNTIQRLRDKNHRWDGDGLSSLVPCAINCGLIGYPFICPDMIGGGEWTFNFLPGFEIDEELFVRMAQCSALFPMMQFSWAPWKALSKENLQICVDAARLHARLAPEILKLVRESEKTGEPILRALEYNDPCGLYGKITDEFMLGEDILVAPVIEKGARERSVLFPLGMWTDEDGNEFEGRSEHVLEAPLEKLLWFRRKK